MDKSEIEQIKSSCDLRAYVMADLGKPASHGAGAWMFRCPFHHDDVPSLAVYPDGHAYCYGSCAKSFDIFSYVQARLGIDFKAALEFLGADAMLPRFERREPEPSAAAKKPVITLEEATRYHFDVAASRSYLDARCFPQGIIDHNLIGSKAWSKTYIDVTGRRWHFTGRYVTLPYLFDGALYSYNSRRDDLSVLACMKAMGERLNLDVFELMRLDLAEKMDVAPSDVKAEQVFFHTFGSRFYRPSTRVTAYGVENVVRRGGDKLLYRRLPYVIVTEGEANQISAQALGYPAVALKAGQGVDTRRLLQNTQRVYVATDPDEAGQTYAEKVLGAFGGDVTKARLMRMDCDMNDLLRHGELASFLGSKPYFLDPIRSD